jgi:hypothetical protein
MQVFYARIIKLKFIKTDIMENGEHRNLGSLGLISRLLASPWPNYA